MEKRKKALVTGGERGIGRGIVHCLAEAGYDIATTYLYDTKEAERIVHEVNALGRECFVYQADLSDLKTTEELISKAVSDLGDLDLLVNNAAVKASYDMLYNLTAQEIDLMSAVNFRGYMLLMRDALRYMMKTGKRGNIVNISSLSASRAFPRFSLYGGLKAAICRTTTEVALEAAPYGIRVNSVLPGAIDVRTREESIRDGISQEDIEDRENLGAKIPLQRLGLPKDIGQAVVWLASDAASYVTGANIPVDGGLSLPGMPENRRKPEETDLGWSYQKILTKEDMKDW